MKSNDLNSWAARKKAGVNKSTFVPQLSTGTSPASQASAVAEINSSPADAVQQNAVPFVDGGYPHGIASPTNPGIQRQRTITSVNGAPPPWVSVPLCRSGFGPPQVPPLGLSPSHAPLNFPKFPVPRKSPVTFEQA